MYEPDEGRYTAVANEMIRLDDWVHPHLNRDHPHWTKPPLTYWAIAASIELFGTNEFAVRFPGALAFFLTIILIYRMGKVFLDRRAWVAPLIYCSSIIPVAASNVVTTDNFLTLWSTALMFSYMKGTRDASKRKSKAWMLSMWFFLGLGFLTKGPAIFLPFITILVYKWFTIRRDNNTKILWFPGAIVFLLIAAPWFVVVIHDYPELGSYFLRKEIIGRIMGEQHRNAQWYGAFTVYVPVLLLGTVPWTYWFALHFYRGVKKLRERGRGFIGSLDEHTQFLFLWLVCPMVVFVVVRSRLPLYLLPLFIPLSLILGQRLCNCSSLWTTKRMRLIGVWLIVSLLMRAVIAERPYKRDARALSQDFKFLETENYDALAFYGVTPIYGLSFYLDKEIEKIDENTLIDELQKDERRIWVIQDRFRKELEIVFREHSQKSLEYAGIFQSRFLIMKERSSNR